MNASAPIPSSSRLRGHLAAAGFYGTVGAVGLATVGMVALGVSPALALVPVGLIALAFLLVKLPLHQSASVLLFLMVALDESLESYGQWRTPLAALADLLHYRLDASLPIPGAAFSGMEVAVVAMLAIHGYRTATGSRLDEAGRVEPASVIRDLLILAVAGVAFSEAIGLARGWGVAAYKLRNLLHPLLLAGFFIAVYRGPRDARTVGRILVFAACAKGVLAHVVQRLARAETGGMWNAALSHGDSLIFSVGACLLVFRFLEAPRRRLVLPSVVMLGLILLGCEENDRRLVWVMIGMSGLVGYLIRPFRGWQRQVSRVLAIGVPVVALYLAVGWNSGSRIFGPVQTLRGVVDTSHDTSAYWREVEVWNIAVTTAGSPLLGMGLGGEYTEVMFNDDISDLYKEYKEWPHNTVLGLLMLMGLFAFTAQWVLLPAVLFLAVRSYWRAESADDRLLALGCVAAVVSCLVMAWGDTGAHYPQFKILVGLAAAFAAKLAVATGAWPRSRPGPSTAP